MGCKSAALDPRTNRPVYSTVAKNRGPKGARKTAVIVEGATCSARKLKKSVTSSNYTYILQEKAPALEVGACLLLNQKKS